jgi:DNA-binding transcriptional ArsR family regulator
MEDFSPAEFHIVEDLETLRVLADPLRNQIYELLIPASANVRQIADRLGVAPSRLYYHINLLEKHGLIHVVETRMVANMVEKVYRAAAYKIDLAPDLLHFDSGSNREAMPEILTSSIDATREDLLRSVNARMFDVEQGGAPERKRNVMVSRTTARIPDQYADAFRERLIALVEEFIGQDAPARQPAEGDQNYALLVAFYPSFYYAGPEDKTP